MSRWQYISGVFLLASGLLGCGDKKSDEAVVSDSGQTSQTDAVTSDAKATAEDSGTVKKDVPEVATDTSSGVEDTAKPAPDIGNQDTQEPSKDTEPADTSAPPTDDGPVIPDDAKTVDVPVIPAEPETSEGKLGEGKPVDLLPPPPDPLPRAKKRVNIDQLLAAIVKTTGMASWVSDQKNLIDKNADTLGRPDYETSMTENRVPGLLFDKILGDSARQICPQLMAKEQAAVAEERIFIKHAALEDTLKTAPEKIAKNMRMLLLRYHGNYLPENSAQLEPWLNLFKVATNDTETPNPVDGWAVVCTTLLSHPDFISY